MLSCLEEIIMNGNYLKSSHCLGIFLGMQNFKKIKTGLNTIFHMQYIDSVINKCDYISIIHINYFY